MGTRQVDQALLGYRFGITQVHAASEKAFRTAGASSRVQNQMMDASFWVYAGRPGYVKERNLRVSEDFLSQPLMLTSTRLLTLKFLSFTYPGRPAYTQNDASIIWF